MLRAFRRSGRGSSERPALPVPPVVGLVGVALVAALALLFVERRRVDAALKDVLLANARVTAELRVSIEALEARDAETRAASREALARLAEHARALAGLRASIEALEARDAETRAASGDARSDHSLVLEQLAELRAASQASDALVVDALVLIEPSARAMADSEAQIAELKVWINEMRAAQAALATELGAVRVQGGFPPGLESALATAVADIQSAFARYANDILSVREQLDGLGVDLNARLERLEGDVRTARLEAAAVTARMNEAEAGGLPDLLASANVVALEARLAALDAPTRRNSHFGATVETATRALAGAVPYVTPATKLAILELVAAQRHRHFV